MGSRTLDRCRFIRDELLKAGIQPGTRLPRREWDQLIVRSLQIGHVQAQNITRDGDLHGLWTRHPHHGPRQGSVELL